MNLNINESSKMSIYRQLHKQIKDRIYEKMLLDGDKLPSERVLAERLGLNRSTVVNAYNLLKEEGLIRTIRGKGTFVTYELNEAGKRIKTKYDWVQAFEEKSNSKYDEIIQLIMDEKLRESKIFFAGGLPSPKLIPTKTLQKNFQNLANNSKVVPFESSPVEGQYKLRRKIKGIMAERKVNAKLKEIMITSGSQQGLDLIIRSFVKVGDVVLVEEPSFFGALQLFKQAGAKIITIPMEKDGMKMDVLEFLIQKHKPKMIYTIPTFHNPTGLVMSQDKRVKLIDLSNQYRVPVVEDDPYGEITFEELDERAIKSFDESNYVIYISTFSKTISLGLRVGWIVAPFEVINCIKKVKQLTDLHVNSLNQHVMSEFLESSNYDDHLEKIKKEYRHKKDLMLKILLQEMGDIQVLNPKGGFYLWVKLEGVEASDLFESLKKDNVIITPGNHFDINENELSQYVRLNYTYPSEDDIITGCRLMGEHYRSLKGDKK